MTILRVYDPPECDANGVPLDYERCRVCEGWDYRWPEPPCPTCDSHGSLKAAALAEKERLRNQAWSIFTPPLDKPYDPTVRCEGCGHRMSEGTWTLAPGVVWSDYEASEKRCVLADAERALRAGREPLDVATHYFRCDDGCDHGGPVRARGDAGEKWSPYPEADPPAGWLVEASWRPVDVRTLGWAHDLRPEKLAVLCLRCYVNQTQGGR